MKQAIARMKAAAAQANPLNQVLKMMAPKLDDLVNHLQEQEKPEEEGGILKEGQTRAVYVLTHSNGKLVLALCPLSPIEGGQEEMKMGKPLRVLSLEEVIAGQLK